MNSSMITSPGIIRAANEALVAITPDINLMRLFATDFSDEFVEPGNVVKVPIAGVSADISAFNESTNNYETTDGQLTWVQVELSAQPKCTFTFKGKDLLEAPNMPFWGTCAKASARAISQYVSKEVGGAMLSTVVTNTSEALSAYTFADFAKLRAEAEGRVSETVVCLAPEYYNTLLGVLPYNVIGDSEPARDGIINNLFGFKAFC